jgi:hypothetical protein
MKETSLIESECSCHLKSRFYLGYHQNPRLHYFVRGAIMIIDDKAEEEINKFLVKEYLEDD